MSKRQKLFPTAPFPFDGFSDREAECVEAILDHCIEIFEIEGKPLELYADACPVLVRFTFEMLPDYSLKKKIAFCKEVTQRLHIAIHGFPMVGSGSA
jgi:hypothetical protein